jgi:hypothetical protein
MNDSGEESRSADLPPGYDEEKPYEDEDISTYPDWWRMNIETFRNHEMRPYRPPRFQDGKITTELIKRLQSDLGCSILLRATDTQLESQWEIYVDEKPVGTVGRHRDADGYTVYEMTSETFEELIRDGCR